MNRAVFVDASAWIAVSDARGKYHEAAKQLQRRLVIEKRPLVTTNLVIAESYIMIHRTGGVHAALRFLELLHSSSLVQKIYSDAALEQQAEDILRQYTDQDFSFADAVSFALMRQLGINEAFAFDHHFSVAGFTLASAMP